MPRPRSQREERYLEQRDRSRARLVAQLRRAEDFFRPSEEDNEPVHVTAEHRRELAGLMVLARASIEAGL